MSTIRIKYNTVLLDVEYTFFKGHPDYSDDGLLEEPGASDSIEIESITTEHGDDITTLFDTTANEIEKKVLEKLEQIKEDDR
jgi:hypothetical protein